MIEPMLWFAAGLVMLLLGADSFLKGASGLALHFGISPFVVGLTIVAFGTSAPELAVNLLAVYRDSYGLALGNVVGSNIANVGLILGACALAAPLVVQMRLLRVEGPVLIGVSVGLWLLAMDGTIGLVDAAIMLAGFAALMIYVARNAKLESAVVKEELAESVQTRTELGRNGLRLAIGLALLVFGAQQMVDAALILARMWGWSEVLIGLTVVAIGTSLPELASSLMAVYRGHNDIAVGNVVGSNLFNILLILGATAAFHPLPVERGMLTFDLPVMISFTIVAYLFMRRHGKITRREGGVLLVGFLAFNLWQMAG